MSEIYYADEHRQMSWQHGTIWLLEGECQLCGKKVVVLDADPEGAGYGTPMCRTCINRKFDEFAQRFGA